MKNWMRISVFLLLIAVLSGNAQALYWTNPIVGMKTLTDGYFYIPNASKIDNNTNTTHVYYLKVDLWCNMSNTICQSGVCGCALLEGDQLMGINPYYNSTNAPRFWGVDITDNSADWPNGIRDMHDIGMVSAANGATEGSSTWNYMADVVPDRYINASASLGSDSNPAGTTYSGSMLDYTNDSTNIHVVFNTGQNFTPNSDGYVVVPPGAVNFTVYNGSTTVMALVTFYNNTHPTANIINGVTLNAPKTNLTVNVSKSFIMNCTPNTDNSASGIDLSFQYSTSGSAFAVIPTSGSLLTANATDELNVRNNTVYSRNITVAGGNDYVVRCMVYNASSNINSTNVSIAGRYTPNLVIAEFRLYKSNVPSQFGIGTQLCDINSSYGSSIPNSNCSNLSFTEGDYYRAEFKICNDQLFGADVNITGVIHGNLTSSYMAGVGGTTLLCGNGSDTGTGTGPLTWAIQGCDWSTLVPNAVYIYGIDFLPFIGNKVPNTRTSYSCQWFTYNFITNSTVNDTWVNSNITITGVTSGPTPKVGMLPILLHTIAHPQIGEFRLYQSSNMTTLGSGVKVCDINSSYGSSIANNSACANNLTSVTPYRAEIEVCDDWAGGGKNINFTAVVQGNLTNSYIGTLGICASGNGTLTQINCMWNATSLNLYMNAAYYSNGTSIPQFTTGNRSNTSCQWFVYNFTTSQVLGSTTVISNFSTQGVSSGINPQVNGLSIGVIPQSSMSGVTISPSSDLNATDASTFKVSCTPSTSGGLNINVTFEYNSTSLSWRTIPASGANLTIDGNNPEVNVSNGQSYNRNLSINLSAFGTYWIRCKVNNATTSLYSSIIKIGVYPAYLNVTINSPSPGIYNLTNPFIVPQNGTFQINASIRCNSTATVGECGNVTCSIRYNKTSALPDTIMNTTQGYLPLYVVSANITYTYTGISPPSLSHQAAWGIFLPPLPNQIQPGNGIEATTDQYYKISAEDGQSWNYSTFWGSVNGSVYHWFRFQINESNASMAAINVYYKGWASAGQTVATQCDTTSYLTTLYIWNFSSGSWVQIGSHSSPFSNVISRQFTSGFSSLVNSSYMYVLVSNNLTNPGCTANISTDFVKVDIMFYNKSIVNCGDVMSNQTCNFSFLVNATGVNQWNDIDVNCSATKATVNQSKSSVLYLYLKGVEVHADKGAYRNCGTVFYKASFYDSSNKPVDQNLTVNIVDSNGNIVNQSKVQTTNGVYVGTYNLQPGSTIGEWAIRLLSCGIYNKTFGVGAGITTNFWKEVWQTPNRVKYSSGETIPITITTYNQAGMNASVGAMYVYLNNVGQGWCRSIAPGQYDCSVTPSSTGVQAVSVTGYSPPFNDTRYFYVGS